uniref:Uncharacterized protein n=1 Tax=Panagrolaimus sp. PS1159 TaxID=55785 RepID=A0AC35GRK4_9BILA
MELHILALTVCSLFALGFGFAENDNFAFTDKVGQGNFAFAKLFAFADDGSMYRLTKRSLQEPKSNFAFNSNGIRNKFAKHRSSQPNEFAFAFAKRSAPFAKRFALMDDASAEWEEVDSTKPEFAKFAKRAVDSSSDEVALAKFAKFAKFAKRSAADKFAFEQQQPRSLFA